MIVVEEYNTIKFLYFETFYFAPGGLHFAGMRDFSFGKIIFGRGAASILPASKIASHITCKRNVVLRTGTVWFSPACQILDSVMLNLAEAFFDTLAKCKTRNIRT